MADSETVPSLQRSLVTGALGFMFVSLVVFATVAFAERWMYATLGIAGAYVAWTALFILLGGAVLGSLVKGRWRLPKFYALFAVAFFAYAVGWCAAYFLVRGAAGEWIGSLAGSVLMAALLVIALGARHLLLKMALMLFVANSFGYFLGAAVNEAIGGRAGMLLWGAIFGLLLGGGLGALLHYAQTKNA